MRRRTFVDEGVAGALNRALFLLLGLLWGMPYALTKIALTTIPPITLVAGRVSLAAAVLWIVVWFKGCKTAQPAACIPVFFVQGGLACLIPYTLIALGQQSVDSALAAILNSTSPLFVCLIGLVCGTQLRGRSAQWLGAVLGFGGVVMVMGFGALDQVGRAAIDQLLILTATFSSALGVIYGRRLGNAPPEFAAAGSLTSAAVVLIPLCLWREAPLGISPSWTSIGALVVNAIFSTALGFVVYFHLLRTIGSVRTASVGYLKPAVGVLIGWIFMAEPAAWVSVVGLVAIMTGVAVIDATGEGLLVSAAKLPPADTENERASAF